MSHQEQASDTTSVMERGTPPISAPTTPTETGPISLTTLPAELRDQIWFLVVYHGEANGCIAPNVSH